MADQGRRERVRLLGYKILRPLVHANRKSRDVCPIARKRVGLAALPEAVAEVQSVAVGEVMVNADAELVGIADERLSADVDEWAGIGERIIGQQILGNGIDERQLVVGNRLARELIEKLATLTDLTCRIVDAQTLGIKRAIV